MRQGLNLTSLGVAGFYYHLGANIQPGVLGVGGRVAMTEMKRKPGSDSPLASGETKQGGLLERQSQRASERKAT